MLPMVLVVVGFLTVAPVVAFAAAEPNQASATDAQVRALSERVDAINARLETLKYASILGSALVTLAGILSYSTLRRWARKGVDRALNRLAQAEVEAQLPKVLESALTKAETQILRLAKLLALRANKAFDEALDEFGWTGRVVEIRKESPIFRRALIDCLYNARNNQKQNREDAWTAVNELLADDQSLDTVCLALKICVSGRRFDDGARILEKYRESIELHRDSAMYAATLLRRQGRLNEALALAERFRTTGDLQTLVTIAALKREQGLFTEAQDVLLPAVQRVISYTGEFPPPAWFRVLNTYIANCIDRNRPGDAVPSAYYLLRGAHGGVELFTVGRLIYRLPSNHPERGELLAAFKASLPRLHDGEARLKCQVTLAEIEGRVSDATRLLRGELDSIESGPDAKRRQMDAYFHRSHLAQVLLGEGDCRQAIDILTSAVQWEYGGEAKYYLALAFAMDNRPDDAVRWLREAIKEVPRWRAVARDEDRLRRHPKVADLLADQSVA
jgi:tetratricopeptide (TPR) repeat protein